MEGEKKNVVYAVIALVVIGLLGWWLMSSKGSGVSGSGGQGPTGVDKGPGSKLSPALQLTEQEKKGDVSDKKAQLLSRVRSTKTLTPEERADIGGIMLTKANIYNFTEEERQAIFEALSK